VTLSHCGLYINKKAKLTTNFNNIFEDGLFRDVMHNVFDPAEESSTDSFATRMYIGINCLDFSHQLCWSVVLTLSISIVR